MTTEVMSAQGADAIRGAARVAADVLRRGGVVALPTETVYGLAADALDARAAARIFEAKERPAFDPLIVHVAGPAWIGKLSSTQGRVRMLAERLADAFWPGPLTMVLPVRPADGSEFHVPDLVRSGLPTVALRCSAHPVMAAVVAEFARPLAAPSANRFGRISPVTAGDVVEELGGRIPLVLDGGACRHGLESTIVAVCEDALVLLRPGPVTREELEIFAPVSPVPRDSAVAAPGMLAGHYAPRTPLRIVARDGDPPADAAACGLLVFGDGAADGYAAVGRLPGDATAAAPGFFAALRRLDSAGLKRIDARAIGETGLGVAIMDRLRRAAHG